MTYRSMRESIDAMAPLESWLFWLAVANFVALWVIGFALGGNALNGMSAEGHYYLGSDGKYFEVSRAVFQFSAWQTYSAFVTLFLGMWALFRGRLRASRLPN